MSKKTHSGQGAWVFADQPDLRTLPPVALEYEVKLHGGFAVDTRPGHGQIYFGMPGCGIMRVDPDLRRQDIIAIPDVLRPLVGEDGAEESDPHAVMSLRIAEDHKSKELSGTLLVRFASGESGPARLEGRVAEALAEARKNDRVALFRELFERITTKTAGRDFVATLPLGAGREALGRLTKFALMLGSIGMTAESVVLEEVEVVEAVEVEPVPVEEKPVEKPVPPPPERRR